MTQNVSDGLVLFAHGSLDRNWSKSIDELVSRVSGNLENVCVEVAYLKDSAPDIFNVVENFVSTGCGNITIVPMFLAAGAHAAKDFPEIARSLRLKYPAVVFEWKDAIGQWEETLNFFTGILTEKFSR
ncbi:MAG TPA: cobalamin biosynthesis protein CbiX [Nitrospirae bacterium]|nr:cobalamin biosynthesis protein CbiX [Nitrospirota bacterium]